MLITAKVLKKTDISTIREVYINGKFECVMLENPQRKEKIDGKTGIADGIYNIGFREDLTPMTIRYREKYPDFFWYHLELKNVHDFKYIYQHIGNFVKDTDGCQLIATNAGDNAVYQSTKAFKQYYIKVASALMRGEQIQIKIGD